ncbi:MAG: choice-of-anchor D domain-containing protein, partial [Candidatus Krumholzibacteria bacterium]
MKRFRSTLAVASIFFAILMLVFSARGQVQNDYVEGQLIIKVKSSVQRSQISDVELNLNSTVTRRFASGAELWDIQGVTSAEALQRYQYDLRFEYIEPNYIIRLDQTTPNDPRFPEMWGLNNTGQTGGTVDADIDAPEAWDIETGDTVLVGIIDTGIDWTHVDLAAHIWTNPGEIPGDGIDNDGNGFIDDVRGWDFANDDNNPMDGNGHGTHVAGTVGAIGNNAIGVVGVNWNATLMPIKFLSDGGSGTTANAILSVEYATMMGVRLTNNSWGGGGFSSALRDAIQAAGTAGILFVAAAGNTGQDADLFPHFPAAYDLDNIISVANTTHNDLLNSGSTFGLVSVDFGAPGTNILSTFPGNSYGSISGTSMASPHVSGAVSLVWSAAPGLGHLEVKDALMQSVDPLPALLGKTVTGGRLNIFTALSRLDSIPPSPVTDLAVIGTGSNTATLQWTASGDDSTDGTASSYDVRYSLSPIDDGNFALATVAPATPTPQPVGATETFQVTGLDFNTAYFFALKVLDEQDNASSTSNSPSGTTLGVPEIAFSPPSLSENLLTGGMVVRIVTIQNLAAGTLDFSFPGLDPLPSAPGDIGGVSSAIGPSWLHAVPNSGRILSGGTMDVEMRFDATGLAGGDFTENVIIANNDPTQPAATLPVSLHVTAAPDIAASPASVNFGAHFIGATVTQSVTISNIGTDVLNVSGVSIDNVEYSVDPTGFVLAPSQTKVLVLTFAPVSVGPIAGTLTVSSDDPDTPALAVALTGVGLIPPEIAVAPGILFENLVFGSTSTQPLTIENNGGSDLIFDISERVAGAVGVSVSVLSLGTSRDVTSLGVKHKGDGKNGPAYDGGRSGSMKPRDPGVAKTTVSTRAAAGGELRILLLHNGDVATIRTDLLAFADITVVDTFDGGTGTPTLALLESYSAVIVILNTPLIDPVATGNVLADYVDGGGGVIITLATFISPWDIQGRFSAEGYFPFSLGSGPVGSANLGSFDPAHPIMAGVTSAFGDLLGVTTLTPGAEWVADWDSGLPLVATQRGKVVAMNVFLAGGSFYGGDIPLMLRNAAQWSGGTGACWLTAEPDAGTVPAGGSTIINVTFEATSTSCVTAGTFLDTIVVASNDPLAPEVLVPVIFNVTGAPDISVADSLVDYGTVFIGVTRLDTIEVSNQGTDVLVVTGVSTDHTDYSVDPGGFVIGVGGSGELVVSFSPTSEGALPAMLTVASDDPDTPSLNVLLVGSGLLPPIVSVSPDSLSEHLFTGGTAVHPLTIDNQGGSDLFWTVRASLSATSALQTYTLTAPSFDATDPDAADGGTTPENIRTTPITALLEDLTDVQILFDRAHGQGTRSPWTTIIADLTSRGATVVDNLSPVTPTLLASFDVFWTVDLNMPWTTSELNALRDWMLSGGSLLLEGDNTSTVPIYNSMLAPLGSGIVFANPSGTGGTTSFIFPHKTTENVNSILLSANIAHLSSVTAPAGLLVNDVSNVANSAYSEVGGGRIVAMADEVFTRMGSADNQLFANQVFDWLAGSVRWLTVEPKEGVTPADSIDVLTATFDAANLIGGLYDASIIITSNDPFTPTVTIPAHLQVTGAPDIEVSDTAFNFGTEFIGGSRSDTLNVSNGGTDVLTVGVATSNADYSADAVAFSLAVGASRGLVVTFAPSVVGPIPATLTLSTNDPDEPSVVVTLSGSGLMPPIVSVAPDSLSDSLFTGLTSAHTLTIDNLGVSDLEFTIVSEEAGASLVEIMQELESLYRPGENGLSQDPADYVTHYEEYAASGTKKDDLSTAGLPQTSAETMELYHRVQSSLSGGVTLFFDDMESGVPGWTHYSTHPNGIDQWGVSTARSHSAVRSWRVTQHSFEGAEALQTPPIDLSLVMDAFLSFQHWYNFDDCSNDPTFEPDGGIVEVSTNGGASWTQIFPVGGYPYTLDDICSNPLRFLPAYSHDGGAGNAFIPAVFDLTPYVGGVISLRFHAGWDCGNCESNEGWYIDDVAVTSEGVGWISVDPATGTVLPGGSATIDVTFDATGLLGADYDANIVIASNDPITPETRVAAHLHVTGAPDIQLSATSLGFGSWFVGSVVPDTILITNIGTDTLFVSEITLSNSEFVMDTLDTSGFVLNATESRELVVTYTPTLVGPQAGTLTIHSNDVGDPTVVVTLSGEGLPAPDGEVYPARVGYRLFTGWTEDRQVIIGNKGDADLEWNVRLEEIGIATQVYTLTAPVAAAAPPESEDMLRPGMIRTDPIGALLDDLTNVKILWDREHGQSSRAGWSVISADLTARGATITDNFEPINSGLLGQYDILWLIDDFNSPWTGDELAAVAGWVVSGGSVLFESDQSVGSANRLLAAIGAEIVYSETNASGGVTSNIHPHEITDNVNMFTVSGSALAHLQTVAPPAGRLIDDIANRAVAAYSRVGSGRIVTLSDELFHNSVIGATDNQLCANQALDWLAAGVRWLSVEPASGTISPNDITQGSIRFDATGLAAGGYDAKIIYETNDPLDPVIEIPAHLTVAAAPDIALSDTSLTYGTEFIGGVSTATFIISNLGRDTLTVGLPPPSKPDFSVSPSNLTLLPGEDQEVVVSFAPTQTGPRLGHLNVVSNDKDEALLFVSLQGEGLVPPVISVAPDSLSDSLFTGQASMQTLTINNSGGNDLTFEIAVEQTGSPLAV